jgi:hypothetical protein
MSKPVIPLKEFDQEMASTRRLLERVPTDKGRWKPHEKSFALGHLAQLVSWIPGWITTSLRDTYIDLAAAGGYSFEPTETLVREFDRNAREAREALGSVVGSALEVPWSRCRRSTGPRRTSGGEPAPHAGRSCRPEDL